LILDQGKTPYTNTQSERLGILEYGVGKVLENSNVRRVEKYERKGIRIITILMLLVLISILLVSDLIQLFLLIELYSLISYILVLYKFNSNIKKYGILYFLIGNMSSAIILIGIIIYYYNTISFSIIEGNNINISNIIKNIKLLITSYNSPISTLPFNSPHLYSNPNGWNNSIGYGEIEQDLLGIKEKEEKGWLVWKNKEIMYNNYGNQIGVLLIIIGILFKLGIFPFMFWIIKIYPLLENKIFTYLLILPQIVYLFKLSDFLSFSFSPIITYFIFFCSIGSILFGSFFGLKFNQFKLIYTSSSIQNIGFLLLFLTILSYLTSYPFLSSFSHFNFKSKIDNISYLSYPLRSKIEQDIEWLENIRWVINNYSLSLNSFYYFLFIYTLLSLNFLFLLIKFQYSSHFYSSSDLHNNNQNNKWVLFCILCTIFSFIGFPPLSGFYPKYYLILLIYSINTNLFFPFGLIIIIISTIASGFYYLYLLISYFNINYSKIYSYFITPTLINHNLAYQAGCKKLNKSSQQYSKSNWMWGNYWNKNLLISLLTLFILFCSYFNPYLISFFYYLSI
jgi:NADH:ubiquinone oxidoreductase subunit 2 (subunit N)